MGTYIVLLGVQGAGKGTQAARLQEELRIPHITSGGLFRAMKSQDTPLARQVQEIMARGDLVPDDITIQVVRARITQPDAQAGFILDGFPRTVPQAQALDGLMQELGQALTAVLFLKITDEEAVRRLSGRRQCRQDESHIYHVEFNPPQVEGKCDIDGADLFQRQDDTPDAIRARIGQYYDKTAPLLDYYRARGILYEVDAARPIDAVTDGVLAAMQAIGK
jgi:adenylate kinase